MLFLVTHDCRRLRINNDKIYIENSDITAYYLDCIIQATRFSEIEKLNTGNIEYRFIHGLKMTDYDVVITLDIPETYVNICKMCSESSISIELPYIEVAWIKQSVDSQALKYNIGKPLYLNDFREKIILDYVCEEDKLYNELIRLSDKYNALYKECCDTENGNIVSLIELSDDIDNLLDRSKNEYDSKLLDKLQDVANEAFLDTDMILKESFSEIFAEYYWNKHFETQVYNILYRIEAGDKKWVENLKYS